MRPTLPVVAWHSMCRRAHAGQQPAAYSTAREVSLADARSVVRLSGTDLFEFLQVRWRRPLLL